MNKEINLSSIVTVVVIGAVAVTSIMFGGKERVEIKTTIDKDYQTNIETVESAPEYLGGLVHNVQEIFSAGIKAGTSETEVINSSGQWVYQINGTTGAFSGTLSVSGALTITGETQADRIVAGGDITQIGYGTTTLTAAHVCDNSVIQIGLKADPTATLTLPATSTLNADCLGANGKWQRVLVQNNATSTMALTVVAGAGIDLQEPVGGDVIIDETEFAEIWFTRMSTVTTTANVSNLRVAD